MTQLSPEWLTQTLQQAGVLPQGYVATVQERKNAAFNSHMLHLTLSYSEDAPSTAPRFLVYKTNLQTQWAKEAGRAEVAFYRQVGALPDHPRITVPCYAAEYDPSTGDSYLLLLDFSDTHHAPLTRDQQLTPGDNLPTDADAAAVVDTLARFHAYWWEHPRLGTETFAIAHWFQDDESYIGYMQKRSTAFHELMIAESDWFPAEAAEVYESVLAGMPHLWERYWRPRIATLRHLTLTHGDSYFANFLCPDDGETHNTYLIDWQSPETLWAASDLANLMATFWTWEQREENRREERLLHRYHEGLKAAGVIGYGWDDLVRDYRLAIIDWLLVPLQDRRDGSRKEYWWHKMQCLIKAFEDWQCERLLPGLQDSRTDNDTRAEMETAIGLPMP